MILTGQRIAEEVAAKRITIEPFDPKYIQPNSVDFHLGDKLLVYERNNLHTSICNSQAVAFGSCAQGCTYRSEPWHLDARANNPTRIIEIPPEGIVLQPGVLYLGHTLEVVGSNHFVPMIAARSSAGRMGLMVYLNSGFGDLGFINQWTLELTVVHPLLVRAGDRVGQFHFHLPLHAESGNAKLYTGQYAYSKGPAAAYVGAIEGQPSAQGNGSQLSAPRPIRFLLLDAGGVLVTEGNIVEKLLEEVAASADRDIAEVKEFWTSSVRVPLWTGKIGIGDAVTMLNDRFYTRIRSWHPVDLKPLPWAEEALQLLPRDQVGILSNHRSEWLLPCLFGLKNRPYPFNMYISDVIGYAKPDVNAYQYAFGGAETAYEPSDILFVDNKQSNVDAAIAFGMQGLLADSEGKWVAVARRMIAESNDSNGSTSNSSGVA